MREAVAERNVNCHYKAHFLIDDRAISVGCDGSLFNWGERIMPNSRVQQFSNQTVSNAAKATLEMLCVFKKHRLVLIGFDGRASDGFFLRI